MIKSQTKITIFLLLFMSVILIGLYLSGWILLYWLKLPQVSLEFDTYWKYVKVIDAPKVAPFAQKIKLSGLVGFGLPLIGFLFLLYGMLKNKPQAMHGDQKFASERDIAAKNMFKQTATGIPIGMMNRKIIYLDGQQFIMLAAPTRSGKGISTAVLGLLTYEHSVVTLDIKQENFQKTSGYRKNVMKHEVFLFNPFAEDGRTHRWNPLSYVSLDPAFRVSDLMSIGAMLYPDGDASQKFWVSQSRNAFLAFTLYLIEQRQHKSGFSKIAKAMMPCTLGGLYRLSSGNGS